MLLSACLSAAGGSYGLGPGVATYDALAAATEKCRVDGGQVVLKGGYDKRDLGSYECKLGGAK
jgi:predicted kinase